MTFGEKLSKLRKTKGYTQERLAEVLGVSRQSISKWESDAAYPETDKLIRLSEMFDCSLDYLLKDGEKAPAPTPKQVELNFRSIYFERKSKTTIHGVPLVHINVGHGRTAKGIVAIGLVARGVLSIGLVSTGVFSIGLLALGLFAFGALALGLLAAGAIGVGIIALGSISVGIVSIGALALGNFSVGALAIGKYFALGDNAKAMIALGKTRAVGEVFQRSWDISAQDVAAVHELLDAHTPSYLRWASAIAKLFVK